MSVMATTEELLHESESRPLTVEDLTRLPDDGKRYELVDGVLIVNAAPLNIHQLVVKNLITCFDMAVRFERTYVVLPGNGLVPNHHNEYVPDLSVIPAEDYTHGYQRVPPELVIEVASQSTSLYDRNLKKDRYERFGIPLYWIVDPDEDDCTLTVFELADGGYKQTARVSGEEPFETTRPFPLRVVPSQLVELYPEF